jgi:DNA topoisomerase-3
VSAKSKDLPNFNVGDVVPVGALEVLTQYTSPPGYLTESELLGMMEANGIGTDASMPTHIENICERNYVRVDANSRTLIPTQLGIMLVHGYLKIDPELVLPSIRRDIEQRMNQISKGQSDYETELRTALTLYKQKFSFFRQNINLMDQLFEGTFTHVSETSGKHLTRCGICNRFMILISSRPVRLFCSICNMTYKLPNTGSIKLYKELRCPTDNFELVLYSDDRTSYPLCPKCFNEPPFEEFKGALTCLTCPNTECE